MRKDCATCKNKVYDITSTTANKGADNDPYTFTYAGQYAKGNDYIDNVCIETLNTCIPKFEFVAITEASVNLPPLDGVIGLAPDDPSNGPSYISMLYN